MKINGGNVMKHLKKNNSYSACFDYDLFVYSLSD